MDMDTIMTDDIQPASQPNNKLTGIGARFKTAREKIGLSEKDIALHLHLNPKLITLIEQEDFQHTLLPIAFLRGHLRSYARLLNIDEEEVSTALEQVGMNSSPTLIKSPILHNTPINNTEDSYVRWLTYFIVFVLLALVAIWWSSHPRDVIIPAFNKKTPPAVTTSIENTPASPAITLPVPVESTVMTPIQPAGTPTAAPTQNTLPTEPNMNAPTPTMTAPSNTTPPTSVTTSVTAQSEATPPKTTKLKSATKRRKPVDDDLQLNMSLPHSEIATPEETATDEVSDDRTN